MTDFLDRIRQLSPQRLALLALDLHEQVEAAAQKAHEPIAVVGMGCRFPGGADDPEAYWQLLAQGRDAIREVPADRWDIDAFYDADPDTPARMSTRSGGFLDRIDGFDPAFFGIAPREALTMDPQQRLLLEVAWEALEHAAISPERLAGTPTGVYLGLCNSDHFQRVLQRGSAAIDAYLASGNAHSVAAGRIAYCLGLQGPALAIDTACSSSLVAIHTACRSLRGGEVRVALAGGVNVMCSPETTIALTKAHMLAPDGRCKTFDAAADGFARGEGCGVVVLKRLADAQADGDRVLALIRGSASNQDGRSGGLTVPNGPAQEAVIRAALADAGLAPADVDYVEAHGTGTSLGDPIEVRALAGALGEGRGADRPLLIGSVKTNFGHLESAAGVAGLIKLVLALQHERIPRHLHFRTPSPHIAWAAMPVQVTADGAAWPRGERRRVAGVSSFGFSGTNAHLIVEEAPEPEAVDPAQAPHPAGPRLACLPLSARSEAALAALAARVAPALADLPFAEAAHGAGAGRAHLTERLAVLAPDAATAQQALQAFVRGEPHPALHRGSAAPGQADDVVFLFSGQGAQYPGMGAELYRLAPVFREVIDRCDTLLGADAGGRRLKQVMFETEPGDEAAIHRTVWTQPALFALEVALARLWQSWGVQPAAVIGHSLGEYAAACVAGVFSLEEGLALVAERGRLLQALPPGGAMAAVFAPAAEVEAALAPFAGRAAIAAINSADGVVVSGAAEAVDAVLAELAQRDLKGHRLFVSFAAHSPLTEPALAAMQAAAAKVPMRPPRIPVAWNLGAVVLASGAAPDAGYWRRHLRGTVRFADGIAGLLQAGHRRFLEVGPHPTLIALAQRALPEAAEGLTWLHSLRRGKADWSEMLASVAQLHVGGAAIAWQALGQATHRAALPTYPFERRSFWIPAAAPAAALAAASPAAAPLLGRRLASAVPLFESRLGGAGPLWLREHRVHGMALVAAPVFLEMAQAAAAQAFGAGRRAIVDFTIREALVLPDDGRTVQLHLGETLDGRTPFRVHAQTDAGGWTLHAAGSLVDAGADLPAPAPATDAAAGPLIDVAAHYAALAGLGIALGPALRSVREARRAGDALLARIVLDPALAGEPAAWCHPALLDGALQAVGMALPAGSGERELFLLTEIGCAELAGPLPTELSCSVVCRPAGGDDPGAWRADVTLRAPDGHAAGWLHGVGLRRVAAQTLARTAGGAAAPDWGYTLAWEPAPLAVPAATLLRSPQQFAPALRERFAELAARHGMAIYDDLLPELDRLCSGHVAQALRKLGFDDRAGRIIDPAAEAKALGIVERHGRLFGRLLEMLREDGVLRALGGRYEVLRPLAADDPAERDALAAQRYRGIDGELATLRRCGPALAEVLSGEQDPLALLFPGGSLAEARQLYVESPYARSYNGALAEALRLALAALPAAARLRVLEIGAGTGGSTGFVLPLLPPGRSEYSFTDLSPHFLERAAETFAAYPFVRYRRLDIEQDPAPQGFAAGSFDVVVAANVLHATADLALALRHARRLLAPGGLLLLLEGVAPERWVDLTFGLTDGWWRFTDGGLRADYPLVSRDTWHRLLASEGFETVVAVPERGEAVARGAAQQALIVARAARVARRYVLVGGSSGIGTALAGRLRDRGDSVVESDEDLSSLPPDAELVDLAALADRGAIDAAAARCVQRLAAFVRGGGSGRAWLVTQGAVAAGGAMVPDGPRQAPAWGLGRVFALEHPARWGGLVDLEPGASAADAADTLLAALDAGDAEDQTAWRGGERLAARLLPSALPAAPLPALRADATYLVTGGFGGLGLLVARWLVERGARHLALAGRRPDLQADGVRALEAAGARVIALAVDVADEAAMQVQFARLAAEAPALRGIVHAAADLDAAPISELSAAQVARMLRPKVAGTHVLQRLSAALPLDFLLLFSSTTALLGASGLAHYAAANAFLDATALADDRPGRRVLSVNWGTWETMRLASSESRRQFREGGLEPMPAGAALDAMGRLLAGGAAQAMVARIAWQVLKPLHEARRVRPLLARLGGAPAARGTAAAAAAPTALAALAVQWTAAAPEAREALLLAFVRGEVAAVLGWDAGQPVPPEAGLFELGMDSLMSVELRRRLEKGVGRPLPSTLTFNHPNVAALAAFLAGVLAPQAPALPVAAPANEPLPAADLDELSDDELEARLLARLKEAQ